MGPVYPPPLVQERAKAPRSRCAESGWDVAETLCITATCPTSADRLGRGCSHQSWIGQKIRSSEVDIVDNVVRRIVIWYIVVLS